MKAAPFTYHRARSVDHAAELLARWAPDGARVLAGGQSLVPLMVLRLAQPAHLVDIGAVPFGAMRIEGGALRIPASVRHAAFTPTALPPPLGPALARVAGHIAHLPIRSRGTVCGSLAHADPAAEWPLVFATLGGEAVAHGHAGTRRIAADAFVQDIMTTALQPEEVLTELRLSLPPPGARLGFAEVSRRAGDYAMAAAFVSLRVEHGVISAARIGVGGAEPRARRLHPAEDALAGAGPEEAAFARAAEAAAATITPMEDPQVDAALRRDLVRTVVRRALADAMAA